MLTPGSLLEYLRGPHSAGNGIWNSCVQGKKILLSASGPCSCNTWVNVVKPFPSVDSASYPEGLVLAFHSTLNRALKHTGKGHIRIERREESSGVRRVRCIFARTPMASPNTSIHQTKQGCIEALSCLLLTGRGRCLSQCLVGLQIKLRNPRAKAFHFCPFSRAPSSARQWLRLKKHRPSSMDQATCFLWVLAWALSCLWASIYLLGPVALPSLWLPWLICYLWVVNRE